ncbi:hypothetical protein Xvie_00747 [Xenorhabdus vietnamensis]|uniref:Uncharacterized protein n=1 Tax=Xenorhabdus vietnamensis TaxID=351656 RepID=A0A1Y2SKI1_9GAMM|nr:ABC-three component system middle component 7 [Xenorhabdus vietnamensis]OTA18061.1 hypothetical protein Xvie_00747 [Xenorhabdus vietnamensis]
MITPNKFTSFEQSLLSKLHYILEALPVVSRLNELYEKVEKNFEDVSEFIACIDVLYILGRIELNRDGGEITNVN